MVSLEYSGQKHALGEGETVLECLERHGHRLSSVCRGGVCQSCMLRCSDGDPPKASQEGLKETWKAQGYFLPCVCTPTQDLIIAPCDDAGLRFFSEVLSTRRLNAHVAEVRLRRPEALEFEPGQFVHVIRPSDALSRPYSIASLPERPHLELHVRIVEGGRMSPWLAGAKPGTPVQLQGPGGDCVYLESHPDQPLVLAGTGTGLSPLYGVLTAALKANHRGPIHLYHGAARPADLYYEDVLHRLEGAHENVRIDRCVLENPDGRPDVRCAPLDRAIFEDHPTFEDHRIYLCGNPTLVASLRKKAFLAGAALKNIHSDPFVAAP